MFIEIDNMLINLDNVKTIVKHTSHIRIYFLAELDYLDIWKHSEEELDKLWEELIKGFCLRRVDEQE